ncbi:MAG: NADH-quinone oxidoreductase subunit NuoE [Deltaproteobacteria bacterium]|nr:NADH-quinone oxidoreductase subunit NuoE [Deltaproteobacteria bacterium]MBW2073368.1 NADH-quinone oxidoreductase subunit NuoE [Deltaproteobacteria bacterium]RLB83227.1 MAG: NADH-quinone oxidoreductase subunit NuoE [Deltaproteobacteria bacterium]
MPEARLKKILSVFEGKKGALISILQRVQEEFGYLPEDALSEIAIFLKVPLSQVFSVATFYAHFHLTRRGDHLVRVCQGTACHVRGARDILETAQYHLGIKTGQTTEDYKYSLERVACLGSCALAPLMVVDDTLYPQVTTKKVIEILSDKKDGAKNEKIESKKS